MKITLITIFSLFFYGCVPNNFGVASNTNSIVTNNSPLRPNVEKDAGFKSVVFWKGQSNDYMVIWTSNDLTYINKTNRTSERLFSWIANSYGDSLCKLEVNCGCLGTQNEICMEVWKFKVVSIVGNYLSFVQNYRGISGTMGEAGDDIFTTVDLLKKKRPMVAGHFQSNISIQITHLFDGKEILNELLKEINFKTAVKEIVAKHKISNIERLDQYIKKNGSIFFENHDYEIPDDFLMRFVIVGYDKEHALVKMGVPDSVGGKFQKHLMLKLKPKNFFKADLKKALLKQSGNFFQLNQTIDENLTTYIEITRH